MTPEEKARVKIDKQLNNAGWDIVSRDEYIPMSTTAVKEALMQGNTESDYLLFIDNNAVAVLEVEAQTQISVAAREKLEKSVVIGHKDFKSVGHANAISHIGIARTVSHASQRQIHLAVLCTYDTTSV